MGGQLTEKVRDHSEENGFAGLAMTQLADLADVADVAQAASGLTPQLLTALRL